MAQKALYFDGVDDKVDAVSAFGDINFKNQAWTVEFWAKLLTPTANQYNPLVLLDATTGTNFNVQIEYANTSNYLAVFFTRTDGDSAGRALIRVLDLTNYITIADWNWFHITYDGSGTPDLSTVKMYVNNVNRADIVGAGSESSTQSNIIRLGTTGNAVNDLKGTIDEVRISDIVRSGADRDAAWNSGTGVELSSDGNTIWLVHLDDETSPTDDASSYSNDGTIDGATWVDGLPFGVLELYLSDSIAISDSISKSIGLVRTDSVGVVDSISKAVGLVKAETVSISDVISKAVSIIKSDTVSVTDSISKAIGLVKADTIAITDSISFIHKAFRKLKSFIGRDLSDDNDEFRELEQYAGTGYPYTYSFHYAEYVEARDLS